MSSAVVRRFNLAFGRQDVDAVMALSTDDTVLETTLPKPDGQRLCGHEAVRRYWEEFFRGTHDARVFKLRDGPDLRAVLDRIRIGSIGPRNRPTVSMNMKSVEVVAHGNQSEAHQGLRAGNQGRSVSQVLPSVHQHPSVSACHGMK